MAVDTIRKVVKEGVMYHIKQESSNGMQYVVASHSVEKDIEELSIYACVDGISVTAIGAGAFAQMPKLRKVMIPENTAIKIAGAAFAGCPRLESFYSFAKSTNLTTQAFRDCPQLKEIWASGEVLLEGQNIFDRCPRLTKLTGDIAAVTDFAFGGSSPFENLVFSQNAKFTKNAMIGATAEYLIFYGDIVLLDNADISMFHDFSIECKRHSMLADLVYDGIKVNFW